MNSTVRSKSVLETTKMNDSGMELRKRNTIASNVPMVIKAVTDSPAHQMSRPQSASMQEKTASPSKRPNMPPALPRTPVHNASMSINRRKLI